MPVQNHFDIPSNGAIEKADDSQITHNSQKENNEGELNEHTAHSEVNEPTVVSANTKEYDDQDEENVTEATTMVENQADEEEQSFLMKLRTNLIFRRKIYIWICLCVSFHILGWNLGLGGPTLLDLKMLADCSLEEASLFFTAVSAGYAIASFVISVTFDRFDKLLHVLLGNFGMTVVMAVIPWSVYYGIMLTLHLLKGFMCGISELAASTLLIHLMGQEVKTYMQVLHFTYTVGGILAPLAAAPFLTQVNKTTSLDFIAYKNETSTVGYNYSCRNDISTIATLNRSLEEDESQFLDRQSPLAVYKIYSIASGLSLLPVILFFLLFLKCDKRLTKTDSKSDEKKDNKQKHLPTRLLIPALIILNLVAFFCFSLEDSVIGFTATYAVKHFGLTKAMASYVTSVYWTSFAVGSFSGIFIARMFAIAKLLLFYSFMLVLSSICLFVTSKYYIEAGLWTFSGTSGFFMSLNFPLLFAWAEEDFLHVSAKIMAALTISSSVGVIISPIIVGVLLELSPIYYSYFILGESITLFFIFILGKLLSLKVKMFQRTTESEIEIKVDNSKDAIELNNA